MNLAKMLELTIAGREDAEKSIQLEEMIKQYIAEEEAKKYGGNKGKQRLTAARNYLKESKKLNPTREFVHGTWVENEKQYMTNTFSAIELAYPLPGLPQLAENVEPPKILDIIRSADDNAKIKVDVPNIQELKSQLKIAKAEAKAKGKHIKVKDVKSGVVNVGEFCFDVNLLIETITVLEEGLEYYICKHNQFAPMVIKDESGNMAIVLPLKKPKEGEE